MKKTLVTVVSVAAVGLLSYGIYEFSRTASAAINLSYDPIGARVKGFQGGQLRLEIDYRFINRESKSLSIDYLSLDIMLPNGSIIAVVDTSKNILLAAQQTTKVTFPVTSSVVNDVVGLISMAQSDGFPDALKLKGTITINGVKLPIDTVYPLIYSSQA